MDTPLRNVRAANTVAMGRNVRIRKHAWFSIKPECKVSIGDNTRIGRHFVIAGAGTRIDIESDVLISERVLIAECYHEFRDVEKPIIDQGICSMGPVRVGTGSWIGMGVCVMPGVTIGKHCVIGANAVVTSDIPDFSVAAGTPARVIKQYDVEKKAWMPVTTTE
ncbi:MAG: acyltransferase [Verrucomicrobia bacterium]|nr:acyltransferase [Verrucomicrobiota bacterium]